MKHFYLKLTLFTLALILTGSCLFILLATHPDNLAKFAPASSELYLYSRNNFLETIPDNQQELLLTWLTQKSTLTQPQWQSILQFQIKELALFTINGQFFGFTQTTPSLKTLLKNQNISFTEANNHLYFPALQLPNTNLTNEPWFKHNKKLLNFSNLTIFIKNPKALNIPNSLINAAELPVVLTATTFQGQNCYLATGNIGSLNIKTTKPAFTITPDTQMYVNGIETAKIAQTVNYSLENLPLLILKTLHGPVEFITNNQNFAIKVDPKQNPPAEVKQNLQFILAQLHPTEKTKLLPDETPAIQLITEPEKYIFTDVANGYQQIKINDINLELNLLQQPNVYYIFNNSPFFAKVTAPNTTPTKSFSAKIKNNFIYLNPTTPTSGQINQNIWLINKNPTKTYICLN